MGEFYEYASEKPKSLSCFIFSGFFIYLRSGGLNNLLNRVHTSDPRFDIWSAHIKMFLLKPWFGQSYMFLTSKYKSSFYPLMPEHYSGFAAHNIYLQSLTEMGIIGSIAIVIILFLEYILVEIKISFPWSHSAEVGREHTCVDKFKKIYHYRVPLETSFTVPGLSKPVIWSIINRVLLTGAEMTVISAIPKGIVI